MAGVSTELSDEQLAEAVSKGDAEALRVLIDRHSRRFYAIAYRILMRAESAEDVVQDAFIKLWTGKAKWEAGGKAKFTSWFHRIVYNAAIDVTRKAEHKVVPLRPELGEQADDRVSQETTMIEDEAGASVREALEALPEKQRNALTYVYYSEMKQAEIAELMGMSLKALESVLLRAKAALRETLGEQGRMALEGAGA